MLRVSNGQVVSACPSTDRIIFRDAIASTMCKGRYSLVAHPRIILSSCIVVALHRRVPNFDTVI